MINILQVIIKIILFISFCIFIIWNRLFREFVSKDLNFFKFPLQLTIFLLILFFTNIILSIIVIKKYSTGNNKYIAKISNIFKIYFSSAPETILALISKKIDLIKWITNPVSYFVAYFNYPKILVICFIFLPTLIISSVFFVEVCFFHQIFYFYKLFPILLLPLTISGINYSIDLIAQAQLDYVTAHLIGESQNGILELRLAPESPDIPNAFTLEEMKEKFLWLCYQYDIFSQIKDFCVKCTEIKNKYSPWISLYSSILFFFSWAYILLLHL